MIIGIDEVGRGCWAGPLLVVAAQRKKFAQLPDGITDSKKLTKHQREALYDPIVQACNIGEGWVQPEEIDIMGLSRAMRLGVSRALMALGAKIDHPIIIDGLINYCPEEFTKVKTIAKADLTEDIVSAASIYAKVTRDAHMVRIAKFHPFYGFENHVGYGTALHANALQVHGVSPLHRRSFKPVQAFL